MSDRPDRPAPDASEPARPPAVGDRLELAMGAAAAGGGCVSRAPDGRVVFVRHALPGERVVAEITGEARTYLRADAVEVVEPSPDRVEPRCPLSGPGGCGGCDYQHVALDAQRRIKGGLVAEQLARLAGLERVVEVEAVPGDRDGLAWRTRVAFAVDDDGVVGLRPHRSHTVVPVERCPIAVDAVNDAGVTRARWPGARQVEVVAPGDGGTVVAVVDTGGERPGGLPDLPVGVVWRGRTLRPPGEVAYEVDGHRFTVRAGVFWQVHPGAGHVLTEAVLDGLAPRPGERAADLYAGAGLFSVALAGAVGSTGSVVAVERSAAAAGALRADTAAGPIEVVQAAVTPDLVARRLGHPDLVVLDPARSGAGTAVMAALAGLDPPPRAVAYVSCEPAPFARDLRILLDAGWTLSSLRAFDLFPMTEHVEVVGVLVPPGAPTH